MSIFESSFFESSLITKLQIECYITFWFKKQEIIVSKTDWKNVLNFVSKCSNLFEIFGNCFWNRMLFSWLFIIFEIFCDLFWDFFEFYWNFLNCSEFVRELLEIFFIFFYIFSSFAKYFTTFFLSSWNCPDFILIIPNFLICLNFL